MSSVLKILVDIPCEVYCDYELKGEAKPQSIFKMELRKGTYILEFKQEGVVLYSQEYKMQSNDEDDLIKVSLIESREKIKREEQYKNIEKLDVCYRRTDDKKYVLENKSDGTITPINYSISQCDSLIKEGGDKCGLYNINVGGTEKCIWAGYADEFYVQFDGGKWGCINKLGEIQIPIIYDSLVYFHDPNVTAALLEDRIVFINKWNEIVFANSYDEVELEDAFVWGLCIVAKNGKYGIIDNKGRERLPLSFAKIIRDDEGFRIEENGKWGLVNDQCMPVTPFMFESLYFVTDDYRRKNLYAKISNRVGIIDYKGKVIVPIEYERLEEIGSGYFLAEKNNRKGILKESEPCCVIDAIYDDCERVEVTINVNYISYYKVTLNGKKGLLDDKGETIFSINYNEIQSIGAGFFMVEKDSKKGVLNVTDQSLVLDTVFDDCERIGVEKNGKFVSYFIVSHNGKMGLFDECGKLILDVKYKFNKDLDVNYMINWYEDGYWVIYDFNDEKKVLYPFDDVRKGWGTQLIVKAYNHYNVYVLKGDGVLEKDIFLYNPDEGFDDIVKSSTNGYYIVTRIQKKGIIDDRTCWFDERIYLDGIVYDYIDVHREVIVAILNGQLIIYNYQGTVIFDKGYQNVPGISNIVVSYIDGQWLKEKEAVIVKRDGKWGCINKFWKIEKEKEVAEIKEYVPCEYDKIAYRDKEIVSESNVNKEKVVTYFVNEGPNGELFYYNFHLQNDEVKIELAHYDPTNWKSPIPGCFLFIDTETTGVPYNYNAPSSDTKNWPRLVQLAWILTDIKGNEIHRGNMIIKPNGFTIPTDATKVHGITTQTALDKGVDLAYAIRQFNKDLNNSLYVVGHNVDFDKKIVGAEMIRLGMEDEVSKKKGCCTMKSTVNFCKISGKSGYKYPKLQELYKILFGREFNNAHNAMSDVEATKECYFELIKRKIEI